MDDSQNPTDNGSKPGAQAALRQKRQAEALRANLARRKAQGRARAEDEIAAPDSGLHGAETDGTTGG